MVNGYSVLGEISDITPGQLPVRKRKVTDGAILFIFVLFWALVLVVTCFGLINGDPRRLFHGFDYQGKLCGVSSEVQTKPLLYWPDISEPKYGVCVEACPANDNGQINCPYDKVEQITQGTTLITSISSAEKSVNTYASKEVAGRYCLPRSQVATSSAQQNLVTTQNRDAVTVLLSHIADLENSWPVLCCAIPIAFFMSWIYVCACDRCGKGVLVFGFLSLIALSVGSSVYCFHEAATEMGNVFRTDVAGDARTNQWWLGLFSACFAAFILLVALLAVHSVNAATTCVHLACDVIDHMPSLLSLVVTEALSKLAFTVGWVILFSYVASMGDVERKEMVVDGKPLHGMRRRFNYSDSELYMLIVYVIAGIWGVEFIGAVSSFTTAYGVCVWYFTENESDNTKPEVSGAVGKGLFVSIRNHLGSLALGAVLVGPLGLLRTLIAYMADQGCAAAHSGSVSSVLCKPCVCIFQCFDRFLVLLSRNAYIEIAIHSENFLPSAVRAVSVLGGDFREVSILSGMTFVFSFVGTACITVVVALSVFLCTKNLTVFNSDTSESFVASPAFVGVAAGIVACMVAIVFMRSFDMVADSLLYCNIVDKSERYSRPASSVGISPNYEPSAMTRMIHKHGRMHARRAGQKVDKKAPAGQSQVARSQAKTRDARELTGNLDDFSRRATAPSQEGHIPAMQRETPGLGPSNSTKTSSRDMASSSPGQGPEQKNKKQPEQYGSGSGMNRENTAESQGFLSRMMSSMTGSSASNASNASPSAKALQEQQDAQLAASLAQQHDPMITRTPRESDHMGHSADPAR
eukprot:gnl/MRDRNA2_/MRDRNA2_110088_c0_seq1.p1 gnl/MRDRNA2_/MRDRNA2_110088_c0~~gnl/MRDRNA2_/MRDRNA2_110088_c0_seq1.p1  ORF type:complete len:805 (+),score=99.45 gnl/MRDRNA2_/MRDRNA2_110088_c0_seq1:103-2517(+)